MNFQVCIARFSDALSLSSRWMPVLLAALVALGGCATASRNVAAKYIPPMEYASYSCYQLAHEFQRIQDRLIQVGGRLDQTASKDVLLGAFGVVMFFPALFVLGDGREQELEYGELKGAYEAVQQSAFLKRCSVGDSALGQGSRVSKSLGP